MGKLTDKYFCNQIEERNNEIAALKSDIRFKDEQISALKASNDGLCYSHDTLSAQIAALKADNERLTLERDAAVEDFQDYATQGSDNFAPFCANSDKSCVDSRGYCIDGKCKGRKWRGIEETP